jgi:hypothetical protein
LVRFARSTLPCGLDVVINPRHSVFERDFRELQVELFQLLGGAP